MEHLAIRYILLAIGILLILAILWDTLRRQKKLNRSSDRIIKSRLPKASVAKETKLKKRGSPADTAKQPSDMRNRESEGLVLSPAKERNLQETDGLTAATTKSEQKKKEQQLDLFCDTSESELTPQAQLMIDKSAEQLVEPSSSSAMPDAFSEESLAVVSDALMPKVEDEVLSKPDPLPQDEVVESEIVIDNDEIPDKEKNSTYFVANLYPPSGQFFSGYRLLQLMLANDLQFGKQQLFHRYGEQEEILFSVASVTEPGSFDLSQMRTLQCAGLIFFMDVAKLTNPLLAFDAMFETSQKLAKELSGELQVQAGKVCRDHDIARLRHRLVTIDAVLDKGQ